jgi:hypothetical protein
LIAVGHRLPLCFGRELLELLGDPLERFFRRTSQLSGLGHAQHVFGRHGGLRSRVVVDRTRVIPHRVTGQEPPPGQVEHGPGEDGSLTTHLKALRDGLHALPDGGHAVRNQLDPQ